MVRSPRGCGIPGVECCGSAAGQRMYDVKVRLCFREREGEIGLDVECCDFA